MAVTVADIDRWLSEPSETEILEFKEAKTQLDYTDFLRYCVAIGNEGDGHLILGVTNKPPRSVVGTCAIANPIEMTEKVYSKLGVRVQIHVVLHPQGRVVVVSIPGHPPGIAYSLEGQFLMRIGQSIQPMSPDQLRHILASSATDWLEESAVKVAASDVSQLLDTAIFFDRSGTARPATTRKVIGAFTKARLIDDLGGGYIQFVASLHLPS
jgi:ATP-dependent DNA helicase RecG